MMIMIMMKATIKQQLTTDFLALDRLTVLRALPKLIHSLLRSSCHDRTMIYLEALEKT